MLDFLNTYQADVLLSVIVICGALLMCKLLNKHFKRKATKKTRTIFVLILVFILVISLLLEIWKDRNSLVNELFMIKAFLPGHDTILYIIAAAVFSHFLQIWLLRNSSKLGDDLSKRHRLRLIARWTSWAFFFFTTAMVLLIQQGWGNAGTFLGLIGAGLALSLQESILCLLGWLYIVFNHDYEIGDRIEINGKLGDVIGITPTHTRLLEVSMNIQGGQSTGRIVTVPNSQVFRNPVYNSTCGFPYIWIEVSTAITFESDHEKARELILALSHENRSLIAPDVMQDITKMQEEYAIHYRHLTPTVYTRIVENGVKLTLRFLSPVRSCRQREHEVSLSILKMIRETPDLEIAYPTSRIYRRTEEMCTDIPDKMEK